MTKHGRKVARDLEWVFYHEVVYHVKAVMRYVSKIDVRWVQGTMDRAKVYDQAQVWLNGERSEEEPEKESSGQNMSEEGSRDDLKRDLEGKGAGNESDEQVKKRSRLATVEAARKRALERRQNQS